MSRVNHSHRYRLWLMAVVMAMCAIAFGRVFPAPLVMLAGQGAAIPERDAQIPADAVRHLSGPPGARVGNRDSRWTEQVRHIYSKIQPWNCDQSLIQLVNRGARHEWLFLDSQSLAVRFERAAPGTELRWLPQDPLRMVFVHQNTVGLWHVADDQTEVLYQFDDLADLRIGPWEGNLSHDGRWLVLSGTHNNRLHSVLFDIHEARVEQRYLHPPEQQVDWISVSASGRYVVLNGSLQANGLDQTQVFDRRFEAVGKPWLDYGRPSHFDLTLDSNGEDVAVGVSKSAPDDGLVIARRLRDGEVRTLTRRGYASHTSARNTLLPGWVFVTYQGELPNYPPYANEVVAVSMRGHAPRRLVRFADPGDEYWAQPQAVPSPLGDQLLWAELRSAGPGSAETSAIGVRMANSGIAGWSPKPRSMPADIQGIRCVNGKKVIR